MFIQLRRLFNGAYTFASLQNNYDLFCFSLEFGTVLLKILKIQSLVRMCKLRCNDYSSELARFYLKDLSSKTKKFIVFLSFNSIFLSDLFVKILIFNEVAAD